MDSQQQSAKSRDGKEQSDKPSDVDNRPLAPSFVDRVVENFDSAKRRVRGLNLESDGVTDIVTLLNDEFRLERRVGNAEGEGGGKSESWIAERINSPGEKVFLKKFNSPKHPTLEEIRDTEFGRNSKRRCERFAQHHEQMRSKLATEIAGSGALVKPIAFGLPNRSLSYVKIYPWVSDGKILDRNSVQSWSVNQRRTFIKTLCLAIWELHRQGLVHGDLKRENILVVNAPIGPVARLIDFDEAYLASDPPTSFEDLDVGTTIFTPEWLVLEDPSLQPANVSMKLGLHTDIFQLSLLLHEIFSDKSLSWSNFADSSQNILDHADASLKGGQPQCSDLGTNNLRLKQQLELSLNRIPSRRPSISSILSSLGVSLP